MAVGSPRRTRSLLTLAVAATACGLLMPAALAGALAPRACQPPDIAAPVVATIEVSGRSTPLVAVRYKHGGVLKPPPTHRAGGITGKPVGAPSGTTIIAWHVRYGEGCDGRLNTLATAPVGTRFTLQATGGEPVTLEITGRKVVKQGNYKPAWFRPGGPYQVTLLTCDDYIGRNTVATFAVPLEPVDGESSR